MESDNLITVKEMLAKMQTGQPFSIRGVSYDRKRRKGGTPYHYPECVLVQGDPVPSPSGPATTRPATRKEAERAAQRRNPAHKEWYTRNVQMLQQGVPTMMLRKVHPPLITHFNGKTVVP